MVVVVVAAVWGRKEGRVGGKKEEEVSKHMKLI